MKPTNMNPLAMRLTEKQTVHVPKGWGYERWIVNNDQYCGKHLHVARGRRCSMHAHPVKHETFHISKGTIVLWIITRQTLGIPDDKPLEYLAKAIQGLYQIQEISIEKMLRDKKSCPGEVFLLQPEESFSIPPGVFHQFCALEQTDLFEFSTPHDDADVVRAFNGDMLETAHPKDPA